MIEFTIEDKKISISEDEYKSLVLDEVKNWLDKGVSVIPVEFRHKQRDDDGNIRILYGYRKWSDFRDCVKKITFDEIKHILDERLINICVVHKNLVEIDVDTQLPDEVINSINTLTVRTGRGYKFLFWCEKPYTSSKVISDKPDIRVKGNLIMVPPSVHPSGRVYYYVNSKTPIKKVKDYNVLVDIATKIAKKIGVDSGSVKLKEKNEYMINKGGKFYIFKEEKIDINSIIDESPPCIEKLIRMSEEERTHDDNVLLRDYLMWVYRDHNIVFNVFRLINKDKFDPKITSQQIVYWYDHEYRPKSCIRIRNEHNICNKNCIIYNRPRSSPYIYYKYISNKEKFVMPHEVKAEYDEPPEVLKVVTPDIKPRKYQAAIVYELINEINNGSKIIKLVCPTSYGKSLVILWLHYLLKQKNTSLGLVEPDRGLQKQIEEYKEKYNSFDLCIVEGKSHYKCSLYSVTADIAPCSVKKNFKCDEDCEWRYLIETVNDKINNGGMIVTNFGNIFWALKCDVIVIDEAHKVLLELASPISVFVPKDKINIIKSGRGYTVIEDVIDYNINLLNSRLHELQEKIDEYEPNDKNYEKVASSIISYMRRKEKLEMYKGFIDHIELYWLKGNKFYIKPITEEPIIHWLSKITYKKPIILVSATPPDVEGKTITVDYYVARKGNAPIIFAPIDKMTLRKVSKEEELLIDAATFISIIYEYYKNAGVCNKAVIHTGNTHIHLRIVSDILEESGYKVMRHEKGKLKDIVDKFIKSDSDFLLVASADAGYDFKGVGLQFILKVPYPNLADPSLQSLRKHNKKLFNKKINEITVRNLVQICGRVGRSENDLGVTVILDEKFYEFYNKNISMFPEDFKNRLII